MFEADGMMILRAHHICCSGMSLQTMSGRGAEFAAQVRLVDEALRSEATLIRAAEGLDLICAKCPLRSGDKCAAPKGGDEGVRKWDSILLRELDIPFGTVMTASEWRALLAEKKPFKLCSRCGHGLTCPGAKAKA